MGDLEKKRPFQSYYEQRNNGGFKLKHDIKRKTINDIRCYNTWVAEIDRVKYKSKITQRDIDRKMVAERYIDVIIRAKQWVREEYREAIFEHYTQETTYQELMDKYYLSESAMKYWSGIYVYAVAWLLGEDVSG